MAKSKNNITISTRAYYTIQTTLLSAFISFGLLVLSDQSQAQIQFQDKTATANPFHTGESWGASWGHLNNDLYQDLYASNHRLPTAIYKNNGDGTFSDVTAAAIPEGQLTGTEGDRRADIHGGTWADIDNDGDDDLFVTRSNEGARVHLFENDGNGVFRDVGSQKGVAPLGTARLSMVYDYDKDGILDLSVGRRLVPLDVFKGGATRFTKVTSSVGIEGECTVGAFGWPAHLFDPNTLIYNCMTLYGFPDHAWDTSTIPWTEVQITDSSDALGAYSDAAMVDLNNDGLQDMVFIVGRQTPSGAKRISSSRIEAWLSVLSRTERSVTFKADGPITVNLHSRYIATKNKDPIDPNFGKYDLIFIGSSTSTSFPTKLPITLDPTNPAHQGTRDRSARGGYIGYDPATEEWTIYISALSGGNQHNYITIDGNGFSKPTTMGLARSDGPIEPVVFFNNGSRLVDVGTRGMSALMCGAIAAADYDNDMDVDLYLVCRTGVENIENRFYWNNGSGSFTLGGPHGAEGPVGAGVLAKDGTGEMAITADYNLDGFIDLFVTNGNRLYPHVVKDKFSGGGQDKLYRNKADNGNRWLMFDLEGVDSNRSGFGAQITVTAGGKTQFREQHGSYHRWSHDHRRVHFGMGSNSTATVTIKWPNGATDVHTNVVTNKLYNAVEYGNLEELNTTPTLSIDNASVSEGNSASLTVNLSPHSSSGTVSVDYATVNGSATAGSDYASKSGTLTFNQGQISKTITLNTLEDDVSEPDETFSVRLSNATNNSTIGQSTGTVTILDDDDDYDPTINIGDLTTTEAGSARFVINLSSASSRIVRVSFQTVNGSATVGSDYTPRSGTIVFQPGDTQKTRTVVITQDNLPEPTETFSMTLSNPVDGVLGQSTGTATITDDDSSNIFCGEPPINRSVDRAIFLWKNCAGNSKWHVRATGGGGSNRRYAGELSTNRSFSDVKPFSIESSDILNHSVNTITFDMTVDSIWRDGFSFYVGAGNTCFNLNAPSGTNVLVGDSRTPVTPPFNIEFLGNCTQ